MNAAVESAVSVGRFTKIGADGKALPASAKKWAAVLDARTGLMWTRKTLDVGRVPWARAMEAAAAVRIGGYEDWSAPTLEQRLSINDYTRFNPALDASVFESEPSGWEWTSTPYAPSPGDFAWIVYFDNGNAYYNFQVSNGFVRAVRAGQ